MYIVEKFPRSFSIETSGKSFETPFFVPAVSSIKTDCEILGYVELIEKVGYPGFLISAYDIFKIEKTEKESLMKALRNYTDKRVLVFLDNGNFEAYWYRDKTWSLNKLKEILGRVCPDFCFSFDIFEDKDKSLEKHVKDTITSIAETAGMQRTGSTIALIHSNPEHFPKVTRKIADYINPEIVAIPERELGFSVFEQSHTIRKIRDEINKTKKPIAIHILGTGNPISILIFTLCGADIYDALDWSNAFIDPKTGQLFHFSQKDLVDCQCKACKMKKVPYNYQVLAHNLIFYAEFLDKIRDAIRNEKIDIILNDFLREKDVSKIRRVIGLK